MITRFLTGNESGAEQGVKDAAEKLELPIDLGEHEENVIQSDGTLIFSSGKPPEFILIIRHAAQTNGKPWILVDLEKKAEFEAARSISDWIRENSIHALHVTGTRQDHSQSLQKAVAGILEGVVYLCLTGTDMLSPETSVNRLQENTPPQDMPQTVQEAVDFLIEGMKLKDRTLMANMTFEELDRLHDLKLFIKNRFGLWGTNEHLLISCRFLMGRLDLGHDDAARAVVTELWKKLRETHMLRVVK